jgi:hypothetical protein
MFALHADPQGKVVRAFRGEEIVRMTDQVAWAQVEGWAATLSPPVDLKGEYPPGGVMFFDGATLATFCQVYGAMLHVTGDRFTKGVDITCGTGAWVSLTRTVAIRPEEEGPQNPTGIKGDFSLLWVPSSLFQSLSNVFTTGDERHPLWCVSSRQVKRAFVYLDISRFSKFPPGQEALIINTLVGLLNEPRWWSNHEPAEALNSMEAQLCIGDGYIYVFPDPLKATLFAGWLAELIQQLVPRRTAMGSRGLAVAFHFRMGVHYGAVYRFWDPGRRDWNYIGDGINGGNRVLSVIDKKFDDILFVSDAVVDEFIARAPHQGLYANVRECLDSRGCQEDKHGRGWRVFVLNHTRLCAGLLENIVR